MEGNCGAKESYEDPSSLFSYCVAWQESSVFRLSGPTKKSSACWGSIKESSISGRSGSLVGGRPPRWELQEQLMRHVKS